MSTALGLSVALILGLIAALTATGRWRYVSLIFAAGSCSAPLLAEAPLFRLHIALVAGVMLMRLIDLLSARDWEPGWHRRLLHVLSVVDSRRLTRAPRAFLWGSFIATVAYAVLAAVSFSAALTCAPELGSEMARWLARWAFGLVGVYAMVEAAAHSGVLLYRLLGFRTPRPHAHPLLACSVGEFWAQRWNRIVSAWLRRVAFAPLARRGHATTGIIATFLLSGILHAYLFGVGLERAAAIVAMGSFFLLQAPLLFAERRLRMRERGGPLKRCWTIGTLVLLSPLFVEPSLQVFGL